MSGFSFLDEEVKEASGLSEFDRSAAKKPPAAWGAAKAKSAFAGAARVSDEAGPQGGAQGAGGAGPSLPFRIREVQMMPHAMQTKPIFSIAKPQLKTE
mmetsp:Transcript_15064/g.35287  ORF Transcript_15064/g.35287 Transcript_15064/m.35287 type:complete len:98 (-) Transcript_15064:83-376(-)|eukprot:CAMPEP_0171106476 /NCGR_PEP_ID=MMETSP0766_2-20121228/64816_1 /TAXON_ID=439317 /ORGANISM="Gambierdiscus australes, Strain CAWD 149" /LENGTH=97 /DNA_ID=CAMNT_0011567565 /DNA_START=75 /DNA_END=368 /DNA_ORIENTATION=+